MTSKKKDPALQSDKEVVILPAETKLKDKIGDVSIAELLSPSRVARVQQLVNDRQKDFLGWVEDDLKVLETCYKSVSKNINKSIPHFTKIKSASFTIKSQAGTFGFDLASEVARSLHNFCEQKFRYEEDQIVVLQKHIEALLIILRQRLTGDGGPVGAELRKSLAKLVEKYK